MASLLQETFGKDLLKLEARLAEKPSGTVKTAAELKLDSEFLDLVEQRVSLSETLKELEQAREQVDFKLAQALARKKVLVVATPNYKVAISFTNRSNLDKVRLVELGVPLATIEKATTSSQTASLRLYPLVKEATTNGK